MFSDLVFTLVRLNPASLAEALGAVGADSVDILFDFAWPPGATMDLGLVKELSVPLSSFRSPDVMLDLVRVWPLLGGG